MLKVFLVEDEFIVRQGIKKNIAWEQHGYDFCGEASDGELALPLIRKHRPDILITDIKMPFMDGLELSRIVRKEFPQIEIMILSGYEEFSYAKEAIRLGISSYLLKPISGDALLREVDQVADRILREKEVQDKYRQEMEEIARQEHSHIFRDLVSGERSVSELLELGERHKMDFSAGCYNILLMKLSADAEHPQEYSNSLVRAIEHLETLDDSRMLFFDRELEGAAVLLKADTVEDCAIAKEDFLTIVRNLADEHELQYAIGVGTPVNRISELKKSFSHASHAFAHRFFNHGSCVIEDITLPAATVDSDLNLADVDPKKVNRSRILDFLRTGERAEAGYFVEDLFENSGTAAMESILFRQYMVLGMYFAVVEFVEELGASREDLAPLDVNRCMSMGVEYSRDYMIQLLDQALTLRDKTASNRYGDVVDAAIRFIEDNYANPDLSLNMAASHVKFSPNYLSKIFSEQTGETFIRFLTDYRINKAKELLRCTTRKSSEIAYDVGYKDPHYFSFLFKKQTGLSPKQYRGDNS